MKRALIPLLLAAICPLAMLLTGFTRQQKELVRHVVIFKYKQAATQDQIRQVTDAFRELKNKIPGIVSFEHGVTATSVCYSVHGIRNACC